MKKLLSFSFSKVYIIVMILISLLVVGGYFSYAMFTVSEERSNAISIVTGNLIYDLTVDGEDIESLVIPANTTMEFAATLSNPNNRIARFNFYYLGNLPDGVSAGYIVEENFNILPEEVGINLEKNGTSGSSNTYKIKVTNASDSSVTINLGASVGLDYNDLSLPSNGHLFEEYSVPVKDIILDNPGENGDIYDDGEDTFITGTNPDNYIWYSGKLWRAVSVNNDEGTVKLITQWNISTLPYGSNSTYDGSNMEMWLNDTTVDGFLGNLRDYENFIKLDSKWNATMTTATTKPAKITMVESPVGLLNIYEYTMSYRDTTYGYGYLNNGIYWYTLTPHDTSNLWAVSFDGLPFNYAALYNVYGVRPSIILRSDVRIVSGNGTEENPYILLGDNDKDLNGVKLNTRYSGEYISFGTGENNLYRLVSREGANRVKITSAEPLKENGDFKLIRFGNNSTISSTNTIGAFLNGEYLTSGKYLTANQIQMLEDNSIWYYGLINDYYSYRLTKYTSVDMKEFNPSNVYLKVGLLRLGELMCGQFNRFSIKNTQIDTKLNVTYWTLTPNTSSLVWSIRNSGYSHMGNVTEAGIKPSFNLKPNVIITSGDGTKNNPFILSVE